MIIGSPILIGGGNKGASLFNFPMTFATIEPQPICKGHIWIKSSDGSYVDSIAFVNNVATAIIANNSLVYEVFDTDSLAIEINQNISVTSEGKTVRATFSADTVGNHPWLAGEVEGLGSVYLPYPRVFIKKDDALYIETAYVWTGTEWHMLSESDTYLICGSNQNKDYTSDTFYPWTIYNRNDNTTIIEHGTIDTSFTKGTVYSYCVSQSTGEYIAYRIDSAATKDIKIFKRTGDTFVLNQTITTDSLKAMIPSDLEIISGNFSILSGYSYRNKLNGSNGLAMSGDGSLLFIPCAYNTATDSASWNDTKFAIVILENVNGQYVYKNYFVIYSRGTYNSGSSIASSTCNISASLDGSVIAAECNLYYSAQTNSYSNRTATCVAIGDVVNGYSSTTFSTEAAIFGCAVAPDGSYGVYSTRNEDVNRYEYVAYSINKQSRTTSTLAIPMSYSNMGIGVCITPDNYLWFLTDNSEDRLYLGQGKYADGVYTQISQCYASVSNLLAFTDGQYNMYSNIFYSAAFDNKNNIMFLTSFYGTNVVTMTKTNDKVTSLTKLSNIPKQMRGGDMTSMFITPYL